MSGYFSDILGENKFPRARDLKTSDSSRNSWNLTLRPNSDDSLFHGINSCKIFGST